MCSLLLSTVSRDFSPFAYNIWLDQSVLQRKRRLRIQMCPYRSQRSIHLAAPSPSPYSLFPEEPTGPCCPRQAGSCYRCN